MRSTVILFGRLCHKVLGCFFDVNYCNIGDSNFALWLVSLLLGVLAA